MLEIIRYASFFTYCGSHIYYAYSIIGMMYRLADRSVLPKKKWKDALILFFVNATYFGIGSALGLGLLKNFGLFWLVFYLQERLLFQVPKKTARFLTLYVTLCTLSNILFYYGVFAIFMNEPLAYFENVFQPMSFLKIYALSFSYFSTTFALRFYNKEKNAAPLRHLISSMYQVKFMLICMAALFAYLLFHGIMYGSLDNSLQAKIWSLSGCVYISVGFVFALRYATKLSYFYYLDEKNLKLQKALDRQKRDVSDLIDAADMDTLTKVRNRTAGMKEILKWMESGRYFVLCLIDLDSLKYVNDFIGHQSGDQYLLKVVEIVGRYCRQDRDLFWRYGGDEFLLAYAGLPVIEAYHRMELIADEVKQEGEIQNLPMQISFGVEVWDKSSDFDTLFAKVDEQMYAMKREHKQQAPQFMRN